MMLKSAREHSCIRRLCRDGRLNEALQVLESIDRQDHKSISVLYVALLQECTKVKALDRGQQIHSHIVKLGFECNGYVASTLVNMYARCGSLLHAQELFDRIPKQDAVLWNAMISGYTKQKRYGEAFRLYEKMNIQSVKADKITYILVSNVCASLPDLKQGRLLHFGIIKSGLESDIYVANALIHMYSKCGSLALARGVFHRMAKRDTVSWTTMIAAYSRLGSNEDAMKVYQQMRREQVEPDQVTFVCLLTSCSQLRNLDVGKQIHADIMKGRFSSDISVGNALVTMYVFCGCLASALSVFNGMDKRDIGSWNAMLAGYAKSGNAEKVWELYQQLSVEGLRPNGTTFVHVLGTFASFEALAHGKNVHDDVLRSGMESDAFVATALVTMYGNCGALENARQVFDHISTRGTVPCNAMLAAYAKHGESHHAIQLWKDLRLSGMKADAITFVCILGACANLEDLDEGKKIHASVIEAGYESEIFVGTALISMYAKCGSIKHARKVFNKMPVRNLVTWNAMITGYSRHESAFEAFHLYQEMKTQKINADEVTFVCLLNSCASLTTLEHGQQIHHDIIAAGFESKIFVATALISMYSKCGCVIDARQIFDSMQKRDRVSWNAMITAYAAHGNSEEAFRLFWRMQEEKLMPDELTFTSLLAVCSHLGMLVEGHRLFNHMTQKYHFAPNSEHCVCMIDLFGRAGQLDDAHSLIKSMPIPPDANVWRAFLSACRLHGNVSLAEIAIKQLIDLEPGNPAAYVLLSNIYGAAGRWEEKAKIRSLMKDRGVRKEVGRSFIDLKKSAEEVFGNDQPEEMFGKQGD